MDCRGGSPHSIGRKKGTIHHMWFLTKLWIPFWLLVALSAYADTPHHTIQQRGAVAMFMFGYGGIAAFITLVYACTRAFRRASRDAAPPL